MEDHGLQMHKNFTKALITEENFFMGNIILGGRAPKKIFINDEKAAGPLSIERG